MRNRKADAYVCAVALVGSAPFLYTSLVLASINIKVTYVSIVQQLSVSLRFHSCWLEKLNTVEHSLFLIGSEDSSSKVV